MNITARKGELAQIQGDLLIVGAFEQAKQLSLTLETVNAMLRGTLEAVMREENFKGKMGQTILSRTDGSLGAKRVLVVGLGKSDELTLEGVREAAAVAFQAVRSFRIRHIVSELFGLDQEALGARDIAQAMVEGVRLSDYSYGKYKKHKSHTIKQLEIVTPSGRDANAAHKGIERGEQFVKGTVFARDLVNTPASHMRPEDLVAAARDIAKANARVRVRVFDRERMERMGAGGILGVAQGSDYPPYLVHMAYKPEGRAKKKVALVGKGVTFDSGGLSLKPADYMMTMKNDMAGAASVLGAFCVLQELAPKAEVHGIFAAVENMPSGKAYRPGDIVTAMNKKTVEVLNTDAEGRLTLMDSLVYAQKEKPDVLIDLATLTGACMVALGEEMTGIMANDAKLANDLLTAAAASGEKMWELPLEKNYKKLLKSNVADLQNIGGKYGGALTAGLFLQEFVDPNTPWAHLDIAGPAFAERDINSYTKKGATGHGVRTLLTYLESL